MSERKENFKRRGRNPKARDKGGSTTNQMLFSNWIRERGLHGLRYLWWRYILRADSWPVTTSSRSFNERNWRFVSSRCFVAGGIPALSPSATHFFPIPLLFPARIFCLVGTSICQVARNQNPSTVVAAISGYAMSSDTWKLIYSTAFRLSSICSGSGMPNRTLVSCAKRGSKSTQDLCRWIIKTSVFPR